MLEIIIEYRMPSVQEKLKIKRHVESTEKLFTTSIQIQYLYPQRMKYSSTVEMGQ